MSAAEAALGSGPVHPTSKVKAFLRLVMIEHSVFALPFAYIAALTAMFRADGAIDWVTLLLVTVAMVGLRTFAMACNRIIDREIDARNPRTASRELVTGAVSVKSAWTGALVAVVAFLGAAALLNPLCLALAPVAVVPMVVYPYGKRFTHYPHAILGLAQAIGPIGAWLAVTGGWSWEAVILGLAVGIWIGGFDLIFGCQDVQADRAHGVRSVAGPVRHSGRAVGRPGLPRGDDRAAGLVRAGHRGRALLLDRHGDRRRRVRVRAPGGAAARSVPAEPGVLLGQRVHRDRALRLRAAGSAGAGPDGLSRSRACPAARSATCVTGMS